MKLVDTISALLRFKGHQVWSIGPDATVYEALELMAEKELGALLVIADSKLVGVFSERDYARKVILHGKSSRQLEVREIMTSPVISVTPEHTVDECMSIMTNSRIRHLPVLEGATVTGVVSIGDLVKWTDLSSGGDDSPTGELYCRKVPCLISAQLSGPTISGR